MNGLELREMLAEAEKPKSDKTFWLALISMPIIGGLIGVGSAMLMPPKNTVQAPVVLAQEAPAPKPEQIQQVSFSPQAEMKKYEATLQNIQTCYGSAGFERTKVAERSYLNSNKRLFKRLDELAETRSERVERQMNQIKKNNENYKTRSGIMFAAVSGQMQRDAIGRSELFGDLGLSNANNGQLRTKTGCLRFFAEVSQGKHDIDIPRSFR